MAKFIAIFLLALGMQAHADCPAVKEARLALAVYGSNWEDANITRTPAGGPYRSEELDCVHGRCQIKHILKVKFVYNPGSPDADSKGYVEYPDINKKNEFRKLSMYAEMLRLAAHTCRTTQIVDNSDSAMIKYEDPLSPVKFDIFNFRKNGTLVSWVRTGRSGRSFILNF